MDDHSENREKESCARCRWTEVRPRDYGRIEYVCERTREAFAPSEAAGRRCDGFET